MTWLMALNAAVALGSIFFGLVALFRPQAMPGRPLASPGSQMTQPSDDLLRTHVCRQGRPVRDRHGSRVHPAAESGGDLAPVGRSH